MRSTPARDPRRTRSRLASCASLSIGAHDDLRGIDRENGSRVERLTATSRRKPKAESSTPVVPVPLDALSGFGRSTRLAARAALDPRRSYDASPLASIARRRDCALSAAPLGSRA